MSRIGVLIAVTVAGTFLSCSRPRQEGEADRKRVAARSASLVRQGRPASGPRPAAGVSLVQDRINQTMAAWVRAADRASVGGGVLKAGPDQDMGQDIWTVVQACGCIAKPGWYPYFLGVARLGDRLSSLRGKTISAQVDQDLIKLYNETALAYNAVRSAPLAFTLPRARLSDLDPRSFRHWLHRLLSTLLDSVRRDRAALVGPASSGPQHRLERAVRALWLSERAGLTGRRLAGMSCRLSASCEGLTGERDHIEALLHDIVVRCRRAARKTLVERVRDVSLAPCVDAWKRLDRRMAQTGGGSGK